MKTTWSDDLAECEAEYDTDWPLERTPACEPEWWFWVRHVLGWPTALAAVWVLGYAIAWVVS